MINKAILLGRVGKVDTKTTKNGTLMANIYLATNRKWTDHSGQQQTFTTWHNVNFFDKLAEIVRDYVQVGNLVYIEGEINNKKIESGDKAGQYVYSVTANLIKLLPTGKKEEYEQQNNNINDDDVPF